ncbi:hypothetical protein K1719_016179 [Acacia pycnantha]|nr:hypothetical protein K1719_016179 [Acacia pycnantha]
MANELEKRKEAAKSDPSIVVQAPDPPPRYEKWKAARLKGDKYINPVVAEVAAKIAYRMIVGIKVGPSREPAWVYPICPRQPGDTECGYYVMLYMYSIIQSGHTSDFDKIFGIKDAYSKEEIDLVRNLLVGYLRNT